MYSLHLFRGCSLFHDGELITGPVSQRRRLAALAVIAHTRSAGVSRDKLTGYFWPEEERERARHFVADSIFTIRKALGKDIVLSMGDRVRLNPDAITTDTWAFEDAFKAGDYSSAAELYRGQFLDGFFIEEAPEFERWTESERDRLSGMYFTSLERLAVESESKARYLEAADWWRRLAAHDPYSARVAVRVMNALEKGGDSAAAMQHASKYERLIRDDLDIAPDPAVMAELGMGEPARYRQPIEHTPSQ